MHLKIPYGNGLMEFSLPSNRLLGVLENKKIIYKDVKKLLYESLEKPLGKGKLEDLTRDVKKVLIVVPDSTRSAHLKKLLPNLLERIRNKSCEISIIVATGLHKKHNRAQLKDLLGDAILKKYKIISHEHNRKSLRNFGCTKDGIPIILNKHLIGCDFIISIGVIEPHLYAGYSGGAKTIAIGLAGEETINLTHNVRFLDNPLTRIGYTGDNPFQDALWEVVDKVPVGYSVNILNDADGRALKILSGDLREVFRRGVEFSKGIFEIGVKKVSSLVICGIGYPKDINLYQASRAINYILNDRPIIRKGGVLIIVASLRDGVGGGTLEKRFYKELEDMSSPRDFIEKVRRRGCVAGEHRAYMVAKPMVDYNILFVSKGRKEALRHTPFNCFKGIRSALDYADDITGRDSKIYVIPRALSTIARLK